MIKIAKLVQFIVITAFWGFICEGRVKSDETLEIEYESKPASKTTKKAQNKTLRSLSLDKGQDHELVNKGFIATLKDFYIESKCKELV